MSLESTTRIASIAWAVHSYPAGISGPLFDVPDYATVHVRIMDADGLAGYGYAYCWHSEIATSLRDMGLRMSGMLLDSDIDSWDFELRERLSNSFVNFLGTEGCAYFLVSALDMAIWDLRCRSLGVSLQRLRGRDGRTAPCYMSSELLPGLSPSECAATAKGFAERGFNAVKMWIRSTDVRHESDRVRAVRDALGDSVCLLVDANQSYSPNEAARISDGLAEFHIEWLEDPIHKDDIDGLAWLCARAPVSIVAGENAYGVAGLRRLLDAAPLSSVLVDLQRIGGISGWMKAEALCEAARCRLTSHSFPHVSARLMAGLSATQGLVEYTTWQDVFSGELPVEQGAVIVPDTPGIGTVPHVDLLWVPVQRR